MKTGDWRLNINQELGGSSREKEPAGTVCIGLIMIVLKPGETGPLLTSDHMVMIIIMTEESIFVVTLSKHLLAPSSCHEPARLRISVGDYSDCVPGPCKHSCCHIVG